MNNQEFTKFYDQYIDKVYRYIFLKVSSKEIAQDLTSEAFLRLIQAQKENEKIENPRAFLYQVARNLIIDHYRDKSREALPLDEAMVVPALANERPDIKAAIASDIDIVREAIGAMDKQYADIILWHYLDDLSVPEIAKILNRPEGTVRVMLHRGLNELRSFLNSGFVTK